MPRRSRPSLPLILLLVAAALPAPPVEALHLLPSVPAPPRVENPVAAAPLPSTGFVAVGNLYDAFVSATDDAITRFDEAARTAYGLRHAAPAVTPVTVFRDRVDPGGRVGGLGEWSQHGSETAWHETESPGADGNWAWWFGEVATGRYPARADALLLSPWIDLDTLGRYTNLVPEWRHPEAGAGGVTGAVIGTGLSDSDSSSRDLVTLLIRHRFQFAMDRRDATGIDGGRVELFLDADTQTIARGGTVLQPLPTSSDSSDGGALYENPVDTFGGPAFSGASSWTVSAFDLTPWTGHQVRIGFRVRTSAFADPASYFSDRGLFENDGPHGWFLDNVTIRAAGLPHRVKIEPFGSPSWTRFEPGLPEIAPGDVVRTEVPIANLGASNETVHVRYMAVLDRSRPDSLVYQRHVNVSIPAGGVYEFVDDGWRARGDERVPMTTLCCPAWIGVSVQGLDGGRLPFPAEPPEDRWLPILVNSVWDVRSRLTVDPIAAGAGTPRNLVLHLENRGNIPATILSVANMTDAAGSLVPLTWFAPSGDRERELTLEPSERGEIAWTVTPPQGGVFHANVKVVNATRPLPRVDPDRPKGPEPDPLCLPPPPDFRNTDDEHCRRHTLGAWMFADTSPPTVPNGTLETEELLPGTGSATVKCGALMGIKDGGWRCEQPASAPNGTLDGWYWGPTGVGHASVLVGKPYSPIDPCPTGPISDSGPSCNSLLTCSDPETDGACPTIERAATDAGGPKWTPFGTIRPVDDAENGTAPDLRHAPYAGYQNLTLKIRYMTAAGTDQPMRMPIRIVFTDVGGAHHFAQTWVPGGRDGLGMRLVENLTVAAEILFPPANATVGSGRLSTVLDPSWRTATVDVDRLLRADSGLRNTWDLSLQKLTIQTPPGPLATYLDTVELSGVPVAHPERGRQVLLYTGGKLSQDVGSWESRTLSPPQSALCTAVSSLSRCWARQAEGGVSGGGSRWSVVRGADDAFHLRFAVSPGQVSALVQQRLITPEFRLTNGTEPVLVLNHSFATPANGFTAASRTNVYGFTVMYFVQAQYRRPNGDWSPFYVLAPDGGHPTPYMRTPLGEARWPVRAARDFYAGDGFYWPSGDVQYFDEDRFIVHSETATGSGPRRDVFNLARADGLYGPPESLAGKTIRLAFLAFGPCPSPCNRNAAGSQVFWDIRDFRIRDRPELTHDIRVARAVLSPSYDSVARTGTLGPGTEIPVDVLVENVGLSDAPEVELALVVSRDGQPIDTTKVMRSLAAGASWEHRFLWKVPETPRSAVTYSLHVAGGLRPKPDMDASDNALVVSAGRFRGSFSVEPIEDARASTTVAPTGGSADTVHNLDTVIRNRGNVPIEDLQVVRTVWRLGETPILVRQDRWTLGSPLQPGRFPESVTDPRLQADHSSLPRGAAPNRWLPGSSGSYAVETKLERSTPNGTVPLGIPASVIIDVLQPVLTDDVEGGRAGGVPGTDWIPDDAGLWHKRTDGGFRSTTSWWIGGGSDEYPDDVDAALRSPVVDLRAAKSAFLTVATNYSTEAFYDGAVVEATGDGGETWFQLRPGTRDWLSEYPSQISAANPAAFAGIRNGGSTGGFSGAMPKHSAIDGWALWSFPLHQVPTLNRAEALYDLRPPAPEGGPFSRSGATYTRESWALGGAANARFEVYNGTVAEPTPRTGGLMWNVGNRGDRSDLQVDTTLSLGLAVPERGPDGRPEDLRVRFMDWRAGTTERDRNGTGARFRIDAGVKGENPNAKDAWIAEQTSVANGAWTARELLVSFRPQAVPGAPLFINFTYASNVCPDSRQGRSDCRDGPKDVGALADVTDNRGWAIDAVSVHRARDGTPIEGLQDVSENTAAWTTLNRVARVDAVDWRKSTSGAAVPGLWKAKPAADGRLAWVLEPAGTARSLPANLDSRLMTPLIDLRGLSSSDIDLRLRHEYNFELRERHHLPQRGRSLVEGGTVEIQVFNETTQRFDPWKQLFPEPIRPRDIVLRAPTSGSSNDYESECPNTETQSQNQPQTDEECLIYSLGNALLDPGMRTAIGYPVAVQGIRPPFEHHPTRFQWLARDDLGAALHERQAEFTYMYAGNSLGFPEGVREDAFNLSAYANQRIRLALHAWGNPHAPTLFDREHWTIRDFEVRTNVFQADLVQFRFRFASDASIRGQGWGVDDVHVGAVAYERNLALEFDPRSVPRAVGPGDRFWINGTVVNRGVAARGAFGVLVETSGPAAGLLFGSDDALRSAPVSTSPLAVGPSGSIGDQKDFAFRAVVPKDPAAGKLTLTVRLVDLGGSAGNQPRPLVDEVAASKAVHVPMEVGRLAALRTRLWAIPERVEAGEAVSLVGEIRNTGSVDLRPVAWINVTNEGRKVVASHPLGRPELPAGAPAAVLETQFIPTSAGNYTVRFDVANATGPSNSTAVKLPVGRPTSILTSSWERASEWKSWSVNTVSFGAEGCTSVARGDGSRMPTPGPSRWSRTNYTAFDGEWSVLFGVQMGSGLNAPGFQNAGLVGPVVDLSELDRPALTFVHRPRFDDGSGGIVEIMLINRTTGVPLRGSSKDNCRTEMTRTPNPGGWFLLLPEGGYTHRSISTTGFPMGEPADFNPLGHDHPVLGGRNQDWIVTRFDLTNQALLDSANTPLNLSQYLARFRLRATTQERMVHPEQGWDVDNVVVSDDDIDVAPPARAFMIDGATKEFAFLVRNPGTISNDYAARVVDTGGTAVPSDWVRLLTPELRVAAGDVGAVRVAVRVPIREDAKAAEYTLTLHIASVYDPSVLRIAATRLQVVPSLHADLVGRLLLAGESVEIGAPVVLSANILNVGFSASFPTMARFWVQPPGSDERVVVAEVPVPPVLAGRVDRPGSVQVSANWTAPTDRLGTYMVGVIVDPTDRVIEYDETNNEAVAQLRVVPLQRPDLVVGSGDLTLLDLAGNVLEAAIPGDLIQIHARVANAGNQPARSVQVALSIGADLVGQRTIPSLAPGASSTFRFTQFAPANSTKVVLQVKTPDVELRDDNNEVRTALIIEAPRFRATTDPSPLTLAPGTRTEAGIVLTNVGTSPTLLSLAIEETGFSGRFEPAEAVVTPGSPVRFEGLLEVGPSIAPGFHVLPLVVERLDGRGRYTLDLPVVVERRPDLRLEATPVSSAPGEIRVPVTIRNDGNTMEEFVLAVAAPSPWQVPPPSEHRLMPGARLDLAVPIQAPSTVRPGPYPVGIGLQTHSSIDLHHDVPVTIEAVARAAVETSAVRVGTSPVVYALSLRNTGNVPAGISLDISSPAGWDVQIEQPGLVVSPGAAVNGTVRFVPRSDDAPALAPFTGSVRLSPTASVPQPDLVQSYAGMLNAMPPELAVGHVTQRPQFNVVAGTPVVYSVEVRNSGLGPAAPIEVGLFVDDVLADLAALPLLAAGDAMVVNLTLTAAAGKHAVVVHADPFARLVETDRDNNAAGWVLGAERTFLGLLGVPSAGGLWVLAIAAAVAIARRRRQ